MMDYSNRIDRLTDSFYSAFGHLPEEELQKTPEPGIWSIAQNIDHIIRVNESYYPTFEAVKNGKNKAPFLAKIGFLVTLSGKLILSGVNPDRHRKMKTFPIWEPAQKPFSQTGTLKKLQQHHEELKAHLIAISPWLSEKTIIPSPANKNIVYTLPAALEIMITHEERHLNQALQSRTL